MTSPHVWTANDDERLYTLIQSGSNVLCIARAFHRSAKRIYERAGERYGGFDAIRSGAFSVRTAVEVGRLFSVHHEVVRLWIGRGYLQAKRNASSPGAHYRHYLITDEALIAFLSVREAWVSYTPRQIQDVDWRRLAEECHAAVPGEWLIPKQVGRCYNRRAGEVRDWIRQGVLPATRIGGLLFVWSSDLLGFVPPPPARKV